MHRRLLLALAVTAATVVAPVVTPVWAGAHPVTPGLHRWSLTGVDRAALAAGPAALDPTALLAADAATGPAVAAPTTARVAASRGPALFSTEISTGRFTAAGVSWSATGAPADVVVQVRVLENGRWSDWQRLDTTEAPDAGTAEGTKAAARVSTEPFSTPDGRGLQVRVDSRGSVAPRDVSILAVDPGQSAADANLAGTPAASAHGAAVTDRPAIISRAQWGADESMRDCTPTYMRTLKVAFVHHTAGSNSYTAAQSASLVRGIYAYHVNGNGWCDVGYNVLVDRYGQIFEGRAGGIDRPVLGAHTLAFNWDSFGVAGMGDFTSAAPPAAMVSSISSVIGWKLGLHGRNPGGRTTLVSAGGTGAKYPEGTVVPFNVVSGHRDGYATSCPGAALYAQLGGIRVRAYQYLVAHTRTSDDFSIIWGTTTWAPTGGKVELHTQSQASGYSARMADAVTSWTAGRPGEWRFFIGSSSGDTRPDLIGVHVRGTESGRVEIREASWASGYQDTDVETVTPLSSFAAGAPVQFAVGGASGGDVYVMFPGASGALEVHALSAASDYTAWSVHAVTGLAGAVVSPDSRLLVSDAGDLYAVLHGRTGSGRSEVHALSAASGYRSYTVHAALPVGPTANAGVQWLLTSGARPDLVLAQVNGTGTGKVEIHRLTATSGFSAYSVHAATSLPQLAWPATQVGIG